MDTNTIFSQFAEAGLLVLAMAIVIYVLWRDNVSLRKDYNAMRDRLQDKLDLSNKDATNAINSASNVMNSMVGTLASLKEVQHAQVTQWEELKEEILDIVKDNAK